jgi:hypothetical protein
VQDPGEYSPFMACGAGRESEVPACAQADYVAGDQSCHLIKIKRQRRRGGLGLGVDRGASHDEDDQ